LYLGSCKNVLGVVLLVIVAYIAGWQRLTWCLWTARRFWN